MNRVEQVIRMQQELSQKQQSLLFRNFNGDLLGKAILVSKNGKDELGFNFTNENTEISLSTLRDLILFLEKQE